MHTSGWPRRSRRKRRSRKDWRWILVLVATEEADQEDESAIISAPEEPAEGAAAEAQ
jgi:hypothetical protein